MNMTGDPSTPNDPVEENTILVDVRQRCILTVQRDCVQIDLVVDRYADQMLRAFRVCFNVQIRSEKLDPGNERAMALFNMIQLRHRRGSIHGNRPGQCSQCQATTVRTDVATHTQKKRSKRGEKLYEERADLMLM